MNNPFGRKLAVFAFITAGMLGLGAAPAFAHNQLISTSPADGSTVAAGSFNIVLNFEEAPMSLKFGEGNLIAITDANSDAQLGAACAYVADNKMTLPVDLDKTGKYLVQWRQVSDDGHPIEGSFSFTLTNTSNYRASNPGAHCVDPDTLIAIDPDVQAKLISGGSDMGSMLPWFFAAAGFILAGTLLAAFKPLKLKPRKPKNHSRISGES